MIATARLLLRPPAPDDLPWFMANMNTAAVTRHLGGVRSEVDYVAGFERGTRGFAELGFGFWTVILVEGGQRIGKCGIGPISSEAAPPALRGQFEIGWSLAEAYWGKGLATEAARAVLRHGFLELGLATIHSQTSDSNRASTRLMDRLGVERRIELDYVDPDYPPADNPTTIYRLTREAWEARP